MPASTRTAHLVALCLALGVAWYLALAVPELTRSILKDTGVTGFLRVVAIVAASAFLFIAVRRRWPSWGWLMAFVCLWLGSGTFAVTLASFPDPLLLLLAPFFLLANAWFVVVPMTGLTYVVLELSADFARSNPFRSASKARSSGASSTLLDTSRA